jgi:3-phenylpropionate/trans-cinnamate dioxygenase ferredoxin subunit
MADGWVDACAADAIDEEDVIRFDYGARTFAIYGLVMGAIIECPKHNGRFDFRTGAAKGAPVCVDLVTYPVKVESGRVFLNLG